MARFSGMAWPYKKMGECCAGCLHTQSVSFPITV